MEDNLNIGSATQPVYIDKNGKTVASNATVGDNNKPVYMKNGVITPSTGTIGSKTKPIYMYNGSILESDADVGDNDNPVYMDGGTIKRSTHTAGSTTKPIYMSDGKIKESNADVGDVDKPVYMSGGVIKQVSTTRGSDTKPIYMSGGQIKESNGSVGSATKPVYMTGGTITPSNANAGSDVKPLKMVNGVLTPVAGNLATESFVNSAVAANQTYIDFNTWNAQWMDWVDKTGGTYDLTIPADGYVSLALWGNRASECRLHVRMKDGNWAILSGCFGTDWWDNINRVVSVSYHGFVKAGTVFRITGGLPTNRTMYLFTPPT